MKTARLFRNGQSQAVWLPKEYRFSGDRVLIKKAGNAVVLLPEKGSWRPLFGNNGDVRTYSESCLLPPILVPQERATPKPLSSTLCTNVPLNQARPS